MIVVNTSVFGGSSIQDIEIYSLKGTTDAPGVPTAYDTVPELTQSLAVRTGDVVSVTHIGMYQSAAGIPTEDILYVRLYVGDDGCRYSGGKLWQTVGTHVVTVANQHKVKIEITEEVTVKAEHKCTAGDLKCWGTQRTLIIEHVKGENW
jgi:hypothetical protein